MKEFIKKLIRQWAKSKLPKPVWIIWHATRQEVDIGISCKEAHYLFKQVKKARNVPGAMAEVGVWTGGSARIMKEADRNKLLYLIDTFKGIPRTEAIDEPEFYKGKFSNTSADAVREYVNQFGDASCIEGEFPNVELPELQYSFVHLDVDTYQSTKDCLKYFYPRMNKGGIIVSHDYNHPTAKGVKKAFDEFFKDRLENIKAGVGSQCLIVKL